MSRKWTADEMPDQDGTVAIVTGANSGLGRITALELARHGAQVVVACRSVEKGEAAAAEILAVVGGTAPRVHQLDLGSLDSVRRFAAEFSGRRVDLLVNNAGVMMTPRRTTTDGFELQLGTNHLGHFALTGLLLEALERSDLGRIVTLSSNEHKGAKSTSTTCSKSTATALAAPTSARSSPTRSLRSSWIVAFASRGRPRSACSPTRDIPTRTCSQAGRPGWPRRCSPSPTGCWRSVLSAAPFPPSTRRPRRGSKAGATTAQTASERCAAFKTGRSDLGRL